MSSSNPVSFAVHPTFYHVAAAWDRSLLICVMSPDFLTATSIAHLKHPQPIRAIAFLPSDGSRLQQPLLVVADEAKCVSLLDINASGRVVASIGPLGKKITSLTCVDAETVIVGDKFGEVHKVRFQQRDDPLSWGTARDVILAHMSTMTHLASTCHLASPRSSNPTTAKLLHHRLVSCDVDGHIRVSRYPDCFSIEQYLWMPPPTSPILESCIVQFGGAVFVVVGALSGAVGMWRLPEVPRDGVEGAKTVYLAPATATGDPVIAILTCAPTYPSIVAVVHSSNIWQLLDLSLPAEKCPVVWSGNLGGVPPLAVAPWAGASKRGTTIAVVFNREAELQTVSLAMEVIPTTGLQGPEGGGVGTTAKYFVAAAPANVLSMEEHCKCWAPHLRQFDVAALWTSSGPQHAGSSDDEGADGGGEEKADRKKPKVEAAV